MQEYAEKFYKSKTWQRARAAYIRKVGGLCERCLRAGHLTPGVIVHHKIHLTQELINQPEIALAFDNLELLCRDCHAAMHGVEKRWKFDEAGRLVIPPGEK